MAYNETVPDQTIGSINLITQALIGIDRIYTVAGISGSAGQQTPNGAWVRSVASITVANPSFNSVWNSIMKGLEQNSGAANSVASYSTSTYFALSSTTAFAAGFFFRARFGWLTSSVTSRLFAGFAPTVFSTADPSAQLNMCGFGNDSADSQLTFMHNDGSGVATKTVLGGGAGFPCRTNAADFYDARIFAAPGQTSAIAYQITNLVTGVSDSGTVGADLPVANTAMDAVFAWSCGATAATTTMGYSGIHVRQDY